MPLNTKTAHASEATAEQRVHLRSSAIDLAAQYLLTRETRGTTGQRLADNVKPRSLADGWQIQRRVSTLRQQAGLGSVKGWKCGVPTGERWVAAALHHVVDASGPGAAAVQAPQLAPHAGRVEPEFAFAFASSLPPRSQPYTDAEIDAALGPVHLALEVLGCRYASPQEATPPELMADSLWHHSMVLGPSIGDANQLAEAPQLALQVEIAGQPRQSLAGRHPNANPRLPLYWLAEFLRRENIGLLAGDVVITGSLAGVIDLPFDRLATVRFGELGKIAVRLHQLQPTGAHAESAP